MTLSRNEGQQTPAVAADTAKRRILCVTDFTARSERAVRRAALLARQMNAEVLFVHAVSDAMSGRVVRMKVNRACARLTWEGERAMQHAPHDAKSSVRLGKPLEVLIAAAREYKPHLIVLARPGQRRLQAIVGTTAEQVIRSTGCSVLVVSGTAEREYEQVVLATERSFSSEHVTRTIGSMGMLPNAHTWIVHAFHLRYRGTAAASNAGCTDAMAREDEWNSIARREVLQSMQEAGVDLERVQVWTEQTRPLTAIERAIEQVRPELLVIGVSRWFALKRLLLGSVADQVFRNVKCDVLAISLPPAERKWLDAA
ncbi:universal stress protein [Povalibacter sp.]|uniref:universal stress protein n=1 Tax=Povalibacter sp. TaxID=1962978 RepID=UPI002F412A40